MISYDIIIQYIMRLYTKSKGVEVCDPSVENPFVGGSFGRSLLMLHASEELGGEEVAKGGRRFVVAFSVALTSVILLFNGKGDNFLLQVMSTQNNGKFPMLLVIQENGCCIGSVRESEVPIKTGTHDL